MPAELLPGFAAVGVYCSMYAFRKPFTMLDLDHLQYWGISYKVWLVSAQVMGYASSKFLGIRLISELQPVNRYPFMMMLIGLAWTSLLLFALVPPPYSILLMFINGLPLGLIWGVVFSYLEGRRLTDLLGSMLASSFIFSSGFVKSIGGNVLQSGVNPVWMPFITGGIFILPFIFLLSMLNRMPPPDSKDMLQRSERTPMDARSRVGLLKKWGGLLWPLILVYAFYTTLRDYRDNFSNEIFREMQITNLWWLTHSETILSLLLLLILGSFIWIKNHMRVFFYSHILMVIGFTALIVSSLGYTWGWINSLQWYVMAGFGVFAGYLPFNCVMSDRLVVLLGEKSNAGFIMYLLDAFGYAGTIGVLLLKEWIRMNFSHTGFFMHLVYLLGFLGIGIALFSMINGMKNLKRDTE